MTLATLTSKGQVTIPKEIRESLNLHVGDKIEIIVTERGEAIIRPVSKKVDDVFCRLHQPGREAVSVETMNEAISQRGQTNQSKGSQSKGSDSIVSIN